MPVDLADRPALVAALADVRDRHGDPEVLLFNASATVMGQPTEVDPDAVAAALAVGVVAGVVCAQELRAGHARGGRRLAAVHRRAAPRSSRGPRAPRSDCRRPPCATTRWRSHDELAPLGVHAGTVTVHGMIAPATPYAPDLIAEAFWGLHTQPRGEWAAEVDFTGGPA